MKTILLQSHHPPPWPGWISRCLESASKWAGKAGVPRLFIHDELFADLPESFLAATENQLLPRTDLGRLLWMRRLHEQGWERVIWLDADIHVFDHTLRFDGDAVGREAWITHAPAAGLRVVRKINNCVLCFDAGSRHLERYIAATLSRAAAPGAIGEKDLGPDLMSSLHASDPFPLHADVAMISPVLIRALARDETLARRVHQQVWGGAPKAANLCGSIDTPADIMQAAMNRLESDPRALAPANPLEALEDAPFEEVAPWRAAPALW